LLDSQHLRDFDAEIVCELPNQRLYEFNGNLKINQQYKFDRFIRNKMTSIYKFYSI